MLKFRSGLLGATFTGVLCLATAEAADIGYGYKDSGPEALWNGPYFGIHGGYAASNLDVTDVSVNGNTFSNNGSGGLGGGTWGWNWQFGHIVYSAEFDLGVLDVSHRSTDPLNGAINSHMDSGVYGDITGRVGYAFDRTLLYTKGGFGYFNGAGTVKDSSIPETTFKTQSFTGWTLGGGVEYKITPNWSMKAEYLHFDLGTQQVKFTSGDRWNNTISLDTVKIGINYEILDLPKSLK